MYILCDLHTVRGRRLPIFRGPQAGDCVQRTRLQWIRFAGRRDVREQTRRVHVPVDTSCISAKKASNCSAGGGQQKTKTERWRWQCISCLYIAHFMDLGTIF